MEDTSVSRKLQMYVVDIKSYLESSVNLEMFLNVEGKDKHQFEDAYSVFVKKYKGIEEYITNYLKVIGIIIKVMSLG